MRRKAGKQLTLELRTHGGARRGAGRKPNGSRPRVAHASRGTLGGGLPVLVTMKVPAGIANLRNRQRFRCVLQGLRKASERFGTRIVELSVQHDHVHLVVESQNARALSRAMQGLAVRLARSLNRSLGRRGTVFADRFHHRALGTPRQSAQRAGVRALQREEAPRRAEHARLARPALVSALVRWLDRGRGQGPARDRVASDLASAHRVRPAGLLHPDHTPGPLS